MKRRYTVWILPVLLIGVFLVWGCSNAREGEVFAQPLTLATPASPANEAGGMALPQQIVVVLVTPTSAQGATSQQDQGQQNQESQSGEGQAVAQAQTTPQPQEGENAQGDQELINMGEQIYSSNCASCHQPNGEGTSAYPALAGSQTLTGDDPADAIDIVVNGRGQMPAFGGSLSTEEIAAVISYERNSWDNSAGVVTADQVSQFQEGGGTQASGDAAQGEDGQGQGAPPPEAQAEQNGGTGEMQATPTPEASPTEQTGDVAAGQGQAAPGGAVSEVSVSQEQGTTVITIRIEIVMVTPEAGAATPTPPAEAPEEEASPTPAEPDAEGQTTPTPEAESGGEAAAGDPQATPVPEDAQPQETPAPEDGESQATPAAEDEGAADGTTGAQGGEGAGVAEAGEEASAAPEGDQDLLRMGEYLYGTTCANCHQLSGEGNTAYPSLVNNEIVIAEDPSAALLTILNGRGHMPAFAGMLSDQEIAAVLSHERTAWDNSASVVTAEQVAQVREGGE